MFEMINLILHSLETKCINKENRPTMYVAKHLLNHVLACMHKLLQLIFHLNKFNYMHYKIEDT